MNEILPKNLKNQLKKISQPTVRQAKPAPSLPTKPLSTKWGSDRGTPLDRYFIDGFIEKHREDIQGSVLEIKNRKYTDSLGSNVTQADVLDIDASNSDANVIADLAAADNVPENTYDCFILTETLQVIFDLKGAVSHAHRILKPGGVLLVTVPCVSPIDRELSHIEQWRFTGNSCRRLFSEAFPNGNIEVETYGNYYTCTAFLAGLAVEEVDIELLQETSDMFIQGVCVRATKAGQPSS